MSTPIEIDVIYENGVFKPLTPPHFALAEGAQLHITLQLAPAQDSTESHEPEAKLTPEKIKELIKLAKIYASVKEFEESEQAKLPMRAGTAIGTVLYMAEDFDEPLEDFEEYM